MAILLLLLAVNGNTDTVRMWLDRGAAVYDGGHSFPHSAALGCQTDAFTPLHISAINDHTDTIKLLLDHGHASVEAGGCTPLHV